MSSFPPWLDPATPRPWATTLEWDYRGGDGVRITGDRNLVAITQYRGGTAAAKANATLIVRAVNERDELIATLRKARMTLIRAIHPVVELDDFDPAEHAVIKEIDAVLAKADAP